MLISVLMVIVKFGMFVMIQFGGLGFFQFVFCCVIVKVELFCCGYQLVDDDFVCLFEKVMVELVFFDECDDVLEWVDEFGFDVVRFEMFVEFKVVDVVCFNFIVLIGQQCYDVLQMEIVIGQVFLVAVFGYVFSQDDQI